jgi:hypothetical protein
VSWAARIHVEGDLLRLRFAPLDIDVEMSPAVARRLAASLLVAAERAEPVAESAVQGQDDAEQEGNDNG